MIDTDPRAHRDRFAGQDVYVLGSGPSLNHMDLRSFLAGKVTVSTNHGCMTRVDSVDYLVTKYHRHAVEYRQWWPHIPTVTMRDDLGSIGSGELPAGSGCIILDHTQNLGEEWTPALWPTDPDHFIATHSSICTAMHWAAYLGAANIVLIGHDCGWIDDAGRVPEYRSQADGVPDDDGDHPLWRSFDRQSQMVKAELQARYGCNVVSLLPFINANMEGHHWRSFAGELNG